MSIAVALVDLGRAVEEFGPLGYLMSAGADGRPRINHVAFRVVEGRLHAGVGGRTSAALAAQPLVSCLWPPVEPGGMSLLVDGEAALVAEGDATIAVITPTWAVRHRPPAQPSGTTG